MKKAIIAGVVVLSLVAVFFIVTKVKNSSDSRSDAGSFTEKALSLFPFGKNTSTTPITNETSELPINNTGEDVSTTFVPARIRQLSAGPVAGAVGITKEREVVNEETISDGASIDTEVPTEVKVSEPVVETVDYVRYIEKNTGHVYDIATDELQATRITNTTIPRISEAYFTNNGTGIVLRYLENNIIRTWSASIQEGQSGGIGGLRGIFLDDNITSLAVSPDTKNIAYTKDIGDVTYGYTSDTSGGSKKQIFDSSFSEWIIQWSRTNTVALTTKATGFLEGYSYNIENNVWKKTTGPVFGLTRNADAQGTYSLISYTTAHGMGLQSLNETTGEKIVLPITTFPEKCVWENNAAVVYCAVPVSLDSRTYPDDWYQGTYFSTDNIWRFDITSGVGTLIANLPTEIGTLADGVQLGLTPNKKMIYFINKRDNTLWGIAL